MEGRRRKKSKLGFRQRCCYKLEHWLTGQMGSRSRSRSLPDRKDSLSSVQPSIHRHSMVALRHSSFPHTNSASVPQHERYKEVPEEETDSAHKAWGGPMFLKEEQKALRWGACLSVVARLHSQHTRMLRQEIRALKANLCHIEMLSENKGCQDGSTGSQVAFLKTQVGGGGLERWLSG